MIYSLKGSVAAILDEFAVVTVGGVGLKVFMGERALMSLSPGAEAELFCHLHVREDSLDLYGFNEARDLELFEMLISVSGVGPRSAVAILGVASLAELGAAIQEGRADLLTRAAGIGRKTAERIILDLRGKVAVGGAEDTVKRMEGDSELIDTLVGLGYRRDQAKSALEKVEKKTSGLEARLKEALKVLGNRK